MKRFSIENNNQWIHNGRAIGKRAGNNKNHFRCEEINVKTTHDADMDERDVAANR